MNRVLDLLPFTNRRKLPIVRQEQFSECGHACLVMIACYHGHDIDLPSLREIHPITNNGLTMLDLVHIADALQLNTRAIRVDLSHIRDIKCPAVLHWNMNHFVVLKKVNRKTVEIHDPASGHRRIPLSEFSNSFTGLVLECDRQADFQSITSTKKLKICSLFENIRGFKASFGNLLLLSVVIELFTLINPIFVQYATDNVANSRVINNLYYVAAGFVLLTLLHAAIEYIRTNYVMYLTYRMSDYFSSGVLKHLINLPLEYFERRHRGDILSRFYSIHEIQQKFTTDSINTLLDGLVIIFLLLVMLMYSAVLSSVVILSLMLYICLRVLSYNYVKQQTAYSLHAHAETNSKFLEILQGIVSIKIFAREQTMYRGWKNSYVDAMNPDIKIAKVNTIYSTTSILLFNLEHILVIYLGATLVADNLFSVGMLVAYLAYRQILVTKSVSFIHKMIEYRLITVQLERLSDILLQSPENDTEHGIEKTKVKGHLSVESLSYQYPGSYYPIFENLSFSIKPREKVVITGPSGIGKTTLLKILLGLIKPLTGVVMLDGMPINTLGRKHYRNMCASVMQDDVLISGSIIDNITFFDTIIDIDRVYESAKAAQIDTDIQALPMGYETLIGDMKNSLSGGQKQRILLARALYKKPKLLFLDEATSHLDEATEIAINNALKKLKVTQIVIAHRQETINMADRVIDLSGLPGSHTNEYPEHVYPADLTS